MKIRTRTALPLLLVASLALAGGIGCGDSNDGGGSERDTLPPLGSDFGDSAYTFVTADTAIEEVTRVVVYSDGDDAIVLILRAGEVARSGSARLVGEVIDDATIAIVSGQVNIDADDTFSNNDVVDADGFVLATASELRGTGIEVGTLVTVNYDFRAVLAERVPLAQVDDLVFD